MSDIDATGQTDILGRIEALNAIGVALSSESDRGRLLERILLGAKRITGADGGTLYSLVDGQRLRFDILHNDSLALDQGGPDAPPCQLPDVPLYREDGSPNHASVVAHAVLSGRTINLPDAYVADGFDFSGTRAFDARTGYRSRSMLTVPMRDHEGQIIGVLQLLNATTADGAIVPFSAAHQRLAESLASQAAIALTRHALLAEITGLFESFVRVIAGAVDAKSPYTGNHCRRVHELADLLASAVDADTGPLATVRIPPADRYQLTLAAWLHDCGKITTPDWVLDKSTRLQRPYDRIEIVAARVSAAKAQLEAGCWRRIAGGADREGELAALAEEQSTLEAELGFLRRINAGDQAVSAADRRRVDRIATRRWCDATGSLRPLLEEDEVANLHIAHGTLLPRERRAIERHAAATAEMLGRLPFPRHLSEVPEMAANHHEHMDGSGYPRGLGSKEISLGARILALCDVFEALTASDRPYKHPLDLSQAMTVMARLTAGGQFDPDVFAVFVRSGVYRRFAERHLPSDLLDPVDEAELLATAGQSPFHSRRKT